jgi:hypothetical protein
MSYFNLPAASGNDDTAIINQALASNSYVIGQPGQEYKISDPLVIESDSVLDMTGCTITLLPNSNCHMVENYAVRNSGRDRNVTVIGGVWNRGNNGGSYNDTHSLFFRRVDDVTVRDMKIYSTNGKYAIAIGDAERIRVRDITFDTASDGVHITGPANMVDIRSLMGRTRDDMVSLTGRDYTHYDDVHGDITNVVIDSVIGDESLCLVKIVSGTDCMVQSVSASHLYGTTTIRPLAIMADQTGRTVANGIVVTDMDVQCIDAGWSLIWIRDVTSTDITIRDVRLRNAMTNNPIILIDKQADLGSVIIDGFVNMSPTQSDIVGVYGGSQIGSIRANRIRTLPTYNGQVIKIAPAPVVVTSSGTSDVSKTL